MPIYEYQCDACQHHFERIQKFSDKPITLCPECHKDGVKKWVSAPSFNLKGTGWYETDFKSKPKSSEKAQSGKSDTSTKKDSQPKKEKTKKADSAWLKHPFVIIW